MENNINYSALTMDEIIFIGRNKDYGAFELRQSYQQNAKRAILGTILITAIALSYQMLYARFHPLDIEQTILTHVELSNVETNVIKRMVPPKTPKAELPKGSANAATAILAEKKPVSDNTVQTDTATPIDQDVEIAVAANPGVKGETAGSPEGTGLSPAPIAPKPAIDNTIPNWVEQMPEFPGGEAALLKYIGNHISYPDYESHLGISGKAIVGFVVDEKGRVTDVKILRGVSAGLDREAVRVIRSLPDFKPGMQSGRNVKVSFVVPIKFQAE